MRQSMSVEEQQVHSEAIRVLNGAGIHYVVAGAVALGHYTGIWRFTKDLDLFLLRSELDAALAALAARGYAVDQPAGHWLANARKGQFYVDLIHGFGGWRAGIDDEWYARGVPSTVLGQAVRIAPIEEMIWIKAYVAHRERFDGADILHLIEAGAYAIDWQHLLDRFGDCCDLLLFYVCLYDFVYPSRRDDIPPAVRQQLARRLSRSNSAPPPEAKVCRGTLLDRFSFLVDVREGWADGRVPWAEAQGWTAGDVARDRIEAQAMVDAGRVRPERAA
jgi:hypothetical protein